jgi:SAM-dependent methyltransferase
MGLAELLREPALASVDVDGVERMEVHRAIIDRKPMIREVFTEIHKLMLDLEAHYLPAQGARIEIGAGVWPIRESDAGVLATDVVAAPHLDRVVDAQAMNFADGSVRSVFGQHCFHHLPDPEAFFNELTRVCPSGGGAILVEPYWSPVAGVLFKRLFASEDYDKSAPGWTTSGSGAMSGANQALSYIVFERDKARFHQLFPQLEIVHQAPMANHVRYLLSGGLNFRQLVPDMLSSTLKGIEGLLGPFNRTLALHHVLVLRKR